MSTMQHNSLLHNRVVRGNSRGGGKGDGLGGSEGEGGGGKGLGEGGLAAYDGNSAFLNKLVWLHDYKRTHVIMMEVGTAEMEGMKAGGEADG
eukprot:1162099-Pelagomonas_calceolata.AAC.2